MKLSPFWLLLILTLSDRGLANWWQEHPDPATWKAERDRLSEKVLFSLSKVSPEDFKPDSSLAAEFRLWQWLGLGEGTLDVSQAADFRALGENPDAVRAFCENLLPEDNQAEALALLLQMQQKAPADVQDFPRLAVALALVLDQPFPKRWPHHQVPAATVPTEKVDAVARLKSMAELQRARRYLMDLRDLTVSELKFMVDYPLVESEMEWARKNISAGRNGFGKVFSSIRYDLKRFQFNQLIWPYPSYALGEIQKRGGICVDQAYFAALCGKAKGLPTLFFTGQGDSGGHAWFGYMESLGQWQTDCGRYAQENYPVGSALDPQTWKEISDTELIFFAKGRERSALSQQAKLLTDFGVTLGKNDGDRWLAAALQIQPEFLPAWRFRGMRLQEKNASMEERREFWEAFSKRFARYADLKVEGQEKLLGLAKERGDEKEVTSLTRLIMVQNRLRRFDLGIGAAAAVVSEKISEGKWPEANTAYSKAMRELQGEGGGTLFYGLVQPFVEAALADGQPAIAKGALQEARRLLKPAKDTLVGRSFLELEAKVTPPEKGRRG